MSHTEAAIGGMETRKSLIRVWLAISAVWIAFWLLIATTIFAAALIRNPFAEEFRTFSVIILAPPLGLLLIGTAARLLIESLSRQRGG